MSHKIGIFHGTKRGSNLLNTGQQSLGSHLSKISSKCFFHSSFVLFSSCWKVVGAKNEYSIPSHISLLQKFLSGLNPNRTLINHRMLSQHTRARLPFWSSRFVCLFTYNFEKTSKRILADCSFKLEHFQLTKLGKEKSFGCANSLGSLKCRFDCFNVFFLKISALKESKIYFLSIVRGSIL